MSFISYDRDKSNLSFNIYCIVIRSIAPEKREIVQIRRLLLSILYILFSVLRVEWGGRDLIRHGRTKILISPLIFDII